MNPMPELPYDWHIKKEELPEKDWQFSLIKNIGIN
jgi:hypothetical protein